MQPQNYQVIVIGGGHAGVEAAWAAANLLRTPNSVALITLDPSKVGVMSCNPAIGGLAKGQLVREIDAMNGLMGLATDATGIQFKVLNTSKGPAVHGPRAQCDKHAYAETVQQLLAARPEISTIPGSVERLIVENGTLRAIEVLSPISALRFTLYACNFVLTTGTFMRGLMHTGEQKTPGGRHGESAAVGISHTLTSLGFELGRLKTGTPPRLQRSSIDWDSLPEQKGDEHPTPFSDLSWVPPLSERSWVPPLSERSWVPPLSERSWVPPLSERGVSSHPPFPPLPQISCRQTHTTQTVHDIIRANLHRAPMYSGQIESIGPRYCPSIEDKVVRFADRQTHGVFLEPESLRDDWIYCNGISTSLPADVQDQIVRAMPGCERAHIYRHGYAVEYDMVRPHQIEATGETRLVRNLFLAGQINGTSGYEEAAAQGLVAGINAARRARGEGEFILARDQAYIGVLMDDLVTKTPVEPYRMFTSRAEHRLLLRADNSADRLTPVAADLGLLTTPLGEQRAGRFAQRGRDMAALHAMIDAARIGPAPLARAMMGATFELPDLRAALPHANFSDSVWLTVFANLRYEPYLIRQRAEIKRQAELEHRRLPAEVGYENLTQLRTEARQALARFRPRTFGQAGRLEGITPADLTLLAVLVSRGQA